MLGCCHRRVLRRRATVWSAALLTAIGVGAIPPAAARAAPSDTSVDVAGITGGLPGLPQGIPSAAGQLANPAAGLGQGVTGIASTATSDLGFSAIGAWVSGAAAAVLHETANVLSETTAPRLDSSWFSTAYWRVAGIAGVLTLPFLFAASVQALAQSDLALLLRAALGYLPLAMLVVAIAAPVTMLMLSASDELSSVVSSAAGQQGVNFLNGAVGPLGAIGLISGSPFLGFLMGLFTVAGALVLWMELLMREAAVYVIVLLLPLVFAAFVWPARRIWALRSVEILTALILSKFAIVAVLSLGGAALGQGVNGGLAGVMAGVALLVLGAFAPWALLRLFPLAEIASGTAGALRGHSASALRALHHADDWATLAQRWVATTAQMSRTADLPTLSRLETTADGSSAVGQESGADAELEDNPADEDAQGGGDSGSAPDNASSAADSQPISLTDARSDPSAAPPSDPPTAANPANAPEPSHPPTTAASAAPEPVDPPTTPSSAAPDPPRTWIDESASVLDLASPDLWRDTGPDDAAGDDDAIAPPPDA